MSCVQAVAGQVESSDRGLVSKGKRNCVIDQRIQVKFERGDRDLSVVDEAFGWVLNARQVSAHVKAVAERG